MDLAFAGTFVVGMSAGIANACQLALPDTRTGFELRRDSLPATQGSGCGFQNVGLGSDGEGSQLSDAVDLGSGRVAQFYLDRAALVVDCRTREATYVDGGGEIVDDICGPAYQPFPVVGADAVLDLSSGSTLTELATRVVRMGGHARDPVRYFQTYDTGEAVWPKERVNLLCGCGIFYPDSPGATQ